MNTPHTITRSSACDLGMINGGLGSPFGSSHPFARLVLPRPLCSSCDVDGWLFPISFQFCAGNGETALGISLGKHCHALHEQFFFDENFVLHIWNLNPFLGEFFLVEADRDFLPVGENGPLDQAALLYRKAETVPMPKSANSNLLLSPSIT